MISDVLCEAYDKIEEYLVEDSDMYADFLPEIRNVLRVMDALRQRLDAPPPD
jgi:hypothetical protein